MSTSTKGEPIVTSASVSDRRTVIIDVTNCSREVDPMTGHVFVPDRLTLGWHDGVLVGCALTGRQARADGMSWLDGRRTGRAFVNRMLAPPQPLADDTPEWVRELVTLYRP